MYLQRSVVVSLKRDRLHVPRSSIHSDPTEHAVRLTVPLLLGPRSVRTSHHLGRSTSHAPSDGATAASELKTAALKSGVENGRRRRRRRRGRGLGRVGTTIALMVALLPHSLSRVVHIDCRRDYKLFSAPSDSHDGLAGCNDWLA